MKGKAKNLTAVHFLVSNGLSDRGFGLSVNNSHSQNKFKYMHLVLTNKYKYLVM